MKTKNERPGNISHPKGPSDLTLEKFLLGELDPSESARIAGMIERSPELQAKLGRMGESGEETLKKYPSELMVRKIRGRAESGRKKTRFTKLFWTLLPAPLAAVLLFALLPGVHHGPAEKYPEERIKGLTTGLQIYRKRGESLERLANGESVRPHDLVQVSYAVEKRLFGIIFSIDGKGQFTLHWPEKAAASPALEPGREVVLPSSFELDASPLYEAFILVTSGRPFESEQILSSAKSGRMDPKTQLFEFSLPAGFQQYSITLRKQP